MIKMAFFDIDNTLFSHVTMAVPASALAALRELRERQIVVVIATGRGIGDVPWELQHALGADYLVTANAQAIYDPDRKLIKAYYLDNDKIDAVDRYFADKDCLLFWKFADGSFIYQGYDAYRTWDAHAKAIWRMQDCPGRDRHYREGCFGGAVMGRDIRPGQLAAAFPDLSFYPYSDEGTDITLKGHSKAVGLEYLCARLGIAPAECIAFGDSLNDLPLIRKAGVGVAMGRSAPELLAAADYVTADILDDGVAKALAHFGLGG